MRVAFCRSSLWGDNNWFLEVGILGNQCHRGLSFYRYILWMGGSVSSPKSASGCILEESCSQSQKTEGACLGQRLDTCHHAEETLKDISFANSTMGYALHESCSDTQDSERACLGQELDTCFDMEESLKETSQDDRQISLIDKREDLMVQALGTELIEVLHGCDSDEQIFGTYPTDLLSENCGDEEMQPPPLDGCIQSGFRTCETFPHTDIVRLQALFADEEKLTSLHVPNEGLAETKTPANAHSIPVAPPRKLVSALKGSRQQQGLTQESKLSVKWAPDVYDPPISSDSHTVKGYSHRSKSKNNAYYKHRHNKGRSSRGSSSSAQRKSAIRRRPCNAVDSQFSKWHEDPFVDLRNGIGRTNGEVLNYTVVTPESKCGSSFYIASLSNVQVCLAEAS